MDRILISTLFALLAAFLTAVVSFVKLVNDKEAKISDFREQWTTSARQSLAELTSKLLAIAHILDERASRSNKCTNISTHLLKAGSTHEKEMLDLALEYESKMLEKTNEVRRELTQDIHHSNQLARLHFKLNDPDTAGLEYKIDSAIELITSIETNGITSNEERVKEITSKVRIICAEISMLSRTVIKNEWEKVKRGEPTYAKTKQAAKWSVVTFFLIFLVTICIHAYISKPRNFPSIGAEAKNKTEHSTLTTPLTTDTNKP